MSVYWSESLSEVADGRVVCAICGRENCGGDSDRDRRETRPSHPRNAIDGPDEETR